MNKYFTSNGSRSLSSRLCLQCSAVLLAIAVAAGCKKEATPVTETNPSGAYQLTSVDTHPLPCTTEHEGVKLTITTGSFVFNPDGTCTSKMVFSVAGKENKRDVNASYTRQGTNITMQWQGAGKTIGWLQDNSFTMNNEGMIFVFRK